MSSKKDWAIIRQDIRRASIVLLVSTIAILLLQALGYYLAPDKALWWLSLQESLKEFVHSFWH